MLSITGGASAACYGLLVVKYPLRELGMNKLNAQMMKLHEPASGAFFILGTVHGAIALLGKKKLGAAAISGATFYLLCTALIAACHMTKDPKKKMRDHRLYSLASSLALTSHICLTR